MLGAMAYRTLTALPLSVVLFAYAASAQPPDPALAAADRTLACVRGPHDDIVQWIRLLSEAKATLQSRTASEAARRDARESITVLAQRLRESAAALGACGEAPRATAEQRPEQERAAPALEPISVHAHRGAVRTVSGAGRVEAIDLHEGLLRLGSALDACYEGLTERRALETGDAHLVFTVAGREVRSPTIQSVAIGDAAFAQCLGRAVRALRLTRGAVGGDVHMDVVLRFGPE